MVGEVRQSLGRDAHTTFLIVDAQSVKNTDTAEQKGFDGGKLVSGIKRHIGVDTNGLPHMIHVTTANIMRQFLPGMDCLYQGEELGLTDAILAESEKKDPFKDGGRDGSRTPMPWVGSQIHAGFTDASPWLPIPHEHFPLAVDAQEQMPDSLLVFYRQAFGLKHKHSALRDGIPTFEHEGEGLTITRSNSYEEVAISLNFGGVPLSIKPGVDLPPFGFMMQHKIKPNFGDYTAAAK